MTLDAKMKALSKQLAKSEGTDLSGLTNSLLVERLKEAGMWPSPAPAIEVKTKGVNLSRRQNAKQG